MKFLEAITPSGADRGSEETQTDSTLTFYGTASGGGTHASGVVFTITSSKQYSDIYDFCAKANCADGAYPGTGVIEGTDGNLYRTTAGGDGKCVDLNGCGTVFQITPDGVLTTLYSFDGADGEYPEAGLMQATNGTFYGITTNGRAHGDGTIFSRSTGLGPFVKTVPTAGKVGATVIILGTDLTGRRKALVADKTWLERRSAKPARRPCRGLRQIV